MASVNEEDEDCESEMNICEGSNISDNMENLSKYDFSKKLLTKKKDVNYYFLHNF